MTTEPPAGSGWQPPAGGYPPPQPPGGQPPEPQPFPASYPPPGRGGPGGPDPGQPGGYPYQTPQPQGQPPQGQPPQVFLPDPPSAPGGFDALPEPPPDLQPALQWGDPTPAPAPPPRPGPPPPLSRLAMAAAALGVLVGGAGLALIVGLVALLRLRKSGKRGRGLAITGMVLTVVWAAAVTVVYVAVLSKPPLRDANGVVIRKGDVKVDKLRIGDCVENWSTSTSVDDVIVVPCSQPHNAEVFHTFVLAGKDYPGDGIVREQSTTTCLDKAKTAVKPDDLKNAKVALLKPVDVSWKRGLRGVTCLTVQNSGSISRSIRK